MKLYITSKTGRRLSDRSNVVYHVKYIGSNKAFCGTEPGMRGDWSSYPKEYGLEEIKAHINDVTCKKCKANLVSYLRANKGE